MKTVECYPIAASVYQLPRCMGPREQFRSKYSEIQVVQGAASFFKMVIEKELLLPCLKQVHYFALEFNLFVFFQLLQFESAYWIHSSTEILNKCQVLRTVDFSAWELMNIIWTKNLQISKGNNKIDIELFKILYKYGIKYHMIGFYLRKFETYHQIRRLIGCVKYLY